MEAKIYEDGFERSFGKEESDIMRQFLAEREDAASWKSIDANQVRFESVTQGAPTGSLLMQSYEMLGKAGVIKDTMANTQLLMTTEEEVYPVRSCALASILNRARISGNALNKVSKDVLAEILNHCLSVASGQALLRVSDEKVSAMHGGDEHEYSVLAMPELFDLVVDRLQNDFNSLKFVGGHFDHTLVTAVWELPDEPELEDNYKQMLQDHHLGGGEFVPAVRFCSSDVGFSSATVYPMLIMNGRNITLGSPLKLEHKHGATLADFDKQLTLLYPRCKDAIQQMGELMDIGIDHPYNTMLRVLHKLNAPKKLSYEAAEQWRAVNGDRECTAYELYIAMCEVVFLLQCSGASGSKIAKTEENIARALKVRWGDYDYAGEVNW